MPYSLFQFPKFIFPPSIIVLYDGEYLCIDHNIALSHSMMLNTTDCKRLVTSKLNSSTKPRGGHCHRRCSHSCDRGQNILTIVFVAWPLDRIANGALTVWPHTLNTNCLPFLMLMAIKMQPSWPHYRVWKLSLTAWPTPKTALDRFLTPVAAVTTAPMGVTTPCPPIAPTPGIGLSQLELWPFAAAANRKWRRV